MIPFFFVTLSAVVYLQQHDFFSIRNNILELGFLDGIFQIHSIYSVLIFTIVAGIYGILRTVINKYLKLDKITKIDISPFIIPEYDPDKIISRQKQYDKLELFLEKTFRDRKYAFIAGNSGSGKSLLLDEYKIKHIEKGEKIYVLKVSDKNNSGSFKKELDDIIDGYYSNTHLSRCVVFDQFESALVKEKIFGEILLFLKKVKETEISVVFICTEDKYLGLLKEMRSEMDAPQKKGGASFEYDIYQLEILPEEKENMLEQLEETLKVGKNDSRYLFFKKLLNPQNRNEVSMIEVNVVRNYFIKERLPEKYEKVLEHENPLDEILVRYFEKVFSELENPELAMVMLYALSMYPHGLTESDFKNLTFAPEEIIKDMLKILTEQKIIKIIDKYSTIHPYRLTHDYLAMYFDPYCKRALSEQIIINIDFYCKEKSKIQLKIDSGTASDEKSELTEEELLSPYYKKSVQEKTSSKFLIGSLWALCGGVFLACVWREIQGVETSYVHFFPEWKFTLSRRILALTVIAAGGAIFYVYHYLQYFAKIFFSKRKAKREAREIVEFVICLLLVFGGMSAIITSILINAFWVSFISGGWMIIAIFHFVLSTRPLSNEVAKIRLKKEGMIYTIVGFSLISLNVMVLWVGNIVYPNSALVMYPYFVIFILFVVLTIRQHMNADFMLAKLGSFVRLEYEEKNK